MTEEQQESVETRDAEAPGEPLPAVERQPAAEAGPRQQSFTFADMKLGVGDRLQIQLPANLQSARAYVKVVGYLENVSLLVTAPFRNGARVDLLENEILIVRAFTRQSAYAFNCSILRVSKRPFEHLHLSFPTRIQGTVIRKSTRVRAGFAARIVGNESAHASVDNISATGALISATEPLGAPGDTVRVAFQVHLHDIESAVDTEATILNVTRDEAPGTGAAHPCRHGVEFGNLQANDRMILKSFVYQQMIENPGSVV